MWPNVAFHPGLIKQSSGLGKSIYLLGVKADNLPTIFTFYQSKVSSLSADKSNI